MGARCHVGLDTREVFELKPGRSAAYDVLVVGGSLGGVLAAAYLGNRGFSVLLLEKRGFLGGALSAGVLPFFPVGVGKADTVLSRISERLVRCGGMDGEGRLHIEQLKVELEECLLDIPGVELRYHTEILIPEITEDRVTAIITQCKSGLVRLEAEVFIDASQNYDLARLLPNGEEAAPEARICTGRVRVGGCTHVGAEAPVIPSFNNFSVYLDRRDPTAENTERIRRKFARGMECDPFDEGISPSVAEVLGARARIRRAFFPADRLLEFSFVVPPEEEPHVRFRALAWRILNFWKEALPGFEDAYLCLSAPELDILGLRLPHFCGEPQFRAGKGPAICQEFSAVADERFACAEETPVELDPGSFTCRSRKFGNLWMPGDSRLPDPDKPFWQICAPALSTQWIPSLVAEIGKLGKKVRRAPANHVPSDVTVGPAEESDVVVVGGGPSGIAAAIAASRNGAKVTLIEYSYDLGGNGTTGGVTSFAGGARGGLYEELLSRLHGEKFKFPHNQAFDPEGYRWLLDRWLQENKVRIVLGGLLVHVECRRKRIDSVIVRHRDAFRRFKARFFIDASGDAELSHRAGVVTRIGREKDGKTQPVTLMYQIAQAESGPHLNWFWRLPHGRFLVNATRIAALGVDSTDITRAEIEGRRQMRRQVDALGAQFAYRLVHSGPRVGIRETRRIEGHYTLTVEDTRAGRQFEDGIGKCNYFLDIHNPEGKKGTFAENVPVYEIPFRSLVPKGVDNLLAAGRCISVTHEAMASLRVMPPCFILGQAAGTAAALCAKTGTVPIKINPRMLRNSLINDGVDLDR